MGLWITKQLRDLKRVIWLGRVAGLDSIGESADGGLSIGAGVTLEAACPLLGAIHPDLGELLRRFGSKQVRASGTVGGNIANGSPIGDLAPGPDRAWRQGRSCARATRRAPFRWKTFLSPMASRIASRASSSWRSRRRGLPQVSITAPSRCRSASTRTFPPSCLPCASISTGGASSERASLAAAWRRRRSVRRRRRRRSPARASIEPARWRAAQEAIGADFTPLTDMRATAAYRSTVAANLLAKALMEISGAGAPTRIGMLHAAE